MGKHIKLDFDELRKLQDFIKRKHSEKGDAFDDGLVAADVSLENLFPGKEMTAEFIKKVRKTVGIQLPRGNRFTGKKKAGRPAKHAVEVDQDVPKGDVELLQLAIDRLRGKKAKIDALILKLEVAVLEANGL